ncbi:MAG: butyrate kinase, partial [Alistipes sp.]|nr:butyrate kinase [Alistipes sp.]
MAQLAISGEYPESRIKKLLAGRGGLISLLGTNDVAAVISRMNEGDERYGLVFEAMCYNISKAIGAMAAVLCGRVYAVILTGGIAYNAE